MKSQIVWGWNLRGGVDVCPDSEGCGSPSQGGSALLHTSGGSCLLL